MGASSHNLWPARLVCLALAALTLALLSPGRLGPDETDMLRQAESGVFHDWHSPLVAWVWGLGLRFWPGTGWMHAVEIGLYFLGIYLAASALIARGQRAAGWVVIALSIMPLTWIALVAAGSKDVLATALLACAGGMLGRYAPGRWGAAFGVLAFLALAMLVRQNVLFAAVPMLGCLAWLAIGERFSRLARAAVSLLAGCLVALALLVGGSVGLRAALPVQPTNLVAALYIFDLAGISKETGTDVADGLLGKDFLASTAECYQPPWWDPYAIWGACPDAWVALFGRELPMPTEADQWAGYFSRAMLEKPGDAGRKRALRDRWASAILTHPLAYLRHRLAHFREALGLGEDIGGMDWVDVGSLKRPAVDAVDRLAIRIAAIPAMMPWAWLALALLGLAALPFLGGASATPIAFAFLASGLCYGLGYLPIGVAWSYRYFHWTIVAAPIGFAWLAAAIAERQARREKVPAAPAMPLPGPAGEA